MKKSNASDTEVPFSNLHLSISNSFVSVSSKFMISALTFNFDIVDLHFWMHGGVPLSSSYGVYVS